MTCDGAGPGLAPVVLQSTLTCPRCAHAALLTMAEDSCRIVYECPACGASMRPKAGDCCVFCSYADVVCPPVQRQRMDVAAN